MPMQPQIGAGLHIIRQFQRCIALPALTCQKSDGSRPSWRPHPSSMTVAHATERYLPLTDRPPNFMPGSSGLLADMQGAAPMHASITPVRLLGFLLG